MGSLEQELIRHTAVGVDTSPFIYLWERHPRYLPLSETLFGYLKNPGVQGITSVITLIESCVLPRREGRFDLVEAYQRALSRSQQVHLVPVDVALARSALALRADYDIRVPDALQIGAALAAGATLFITNDRLLQRVKELEVLVLEDYAA